MPPKDAPNILLIITDDAGFAIPSTFGGDANQWEPNLFRNTTQIYPWAGQEGTLKLDRSDPNAEIWPVTGEEPSWNLITAMADDAIDWMTRIHQTNPAQPIFIKYVPGSSHAPHHPTKEWVDKIHAMHLFDDGYEKLRERIFENQKRLGVIPEDEELTPWPEDILPRWDSLSDEAKKLYIRQVEVFAAYVAYTDHEIGRVIQAFEDLGKLDNTLVIYINGDNGTSAEGGPDDQSEDIAADHPDKVKEMRAMFLEEAKKYQVLPLNASVASRVAAPRPSLTAGLNELVYTRPMTGLPQGDAPFLLNTSYTITADITVPEGGAEGMIVTSGGRFAGWGLYLLDGKPVFNWNLLNLEWVKWEGPDALTPGRHTVEFDFEYDGKGLGTIAYNSFAGVGKGSMGRLKVDGKVVAEQRMEKTIPIILQWDESFDIGSDTRTGIDDADYLPPFPLTAKLEKLTIRIDRPQLSPEDIEKLEAAMQQSALGIQ